MQGTLGYRQSQLWKETVQERPAVLPPESLVLEIGAECCGPCRVVSLGGSRERARKSIPDEGNQAL